MNNLKPSRRSFTVGMLASLTPIGATTAAAIGNLAANGVGSQNGDARKIREQAHLHQIREFDDIYLIPTAWEQSLNGDGSFSL